MTQDKLQKQIDLLSQFSQKLGSLIKENIRQLYHEQFQQVFQILIHAFQNSESNSLLLLSRSKQTIHAFLNCIEQEVHELNQKTNARQKEEQVTKSQLEQQQQSNRNKKFSQIQEEEESPKELRVVRVNSILNNTEQKMLTKFFESLNIKGQKSYHIEMIKEVQDYFSEQKNLCILFVLEDIDFYIEWSK